MEQERPVTIAFDVMGSDYGPEELVRGVAALTLDAPRALHVVLVGDQGVIDHALGLVPHRAELLSVQHAPQVVEMHEKPAEALDAKPESSLAWAARLVRDGEADGWVSAGNTGACVLACARHFSLLPGVRRAALASVYPTRLRRGPREDPFSLILDVGATVDATADDLVQFALMGAAYARIISSNPAPKVALLSNGTESLKGPPAVVEAHRRLRQRGDLNFIGNVEGVDIPKGTADVVVCDGFVGNVALKMLEGVHETAMDLAQYAYKRKLLWRAGIALLSSGFDRLKALTDWEQYGGAPVLGFDRVFIKAHGRSRARAIANAGKVAAKVVSRQLGPSIAEALAR